MNEQWTIWQPIENLEPIYQSVTITTPDQAFVITLHNNNTTVQITFPHGVHSHMVTPHSSKIKSYLHAIDYPKDMWSLYQSTNSPYLQWMSEQSSTLSDIFPLIHFVCIANITLLDIIAPYEPTVTQKQ